MPSLGIMHFSKSNVGGGHHPFYNGPPWAQPRVPRTGSSGLPGDPSQITIWRHKHASSHHEQAQQPRLRVALDCIVGLHGRHGRLPGLQDMAGVEGGEALVPTGVGCRQLPLGGGQLPPGEATQFLGARQVAGPRGLKMDTLTRLIPLLRVKARQTLACVCVCVRARCT